MAECALIAGKSGAFPPKSSPSLSHRACWPVQGLWRVLPPQENCQCSPMASPCGLSSKLPPKVVLLAQTSRQAAPMTVSRSILCSVFHPGLSRCSVYKQYTTLPSRPPTSKCYLLVFSAQFAIAPPLNEARCSSIDVCILHAASFHTY